MEKEWEVSKWKEGWKERKDQKEVAGRSRDAGMKKNKRLEKIEDKKKGDNKK